MGEGEAADSVQENTIPDGSTSTDAASSEVPAKKLARQLDFTGLGRMSTSVILPEHPQTQSQVQLQSRSQLPAAVASPPLSQPQLLPPQLQPQMVVIPVVPSPRVAKPDSPKSRPRSSVEVKDCTPKKQKQCNCKHSRCLKLYCECFASGIYCDGCNCINCYNNVENEAARREAVESTLERNPNAFRPKIASSPHGTRDNREEAGEVLMLGKHNKGCHCKKSGCLKKYCECFQANILCSDNCKCMDCKNFEESEERQALFHGDHHGNNSAYIQQAANAAITGAIGSSGYASPPMSKKRKGHELFFGPTPKDSPTHRLAQFQQTNQIRTSPASLPSTPVTRAGSNPALAPSKFTYRSLLADIIQPQDSMELCSVLVVLTSETAKSVADQRNATERQANNQTETRLASTTHERLESRKESVEKAVDNDCSIANQDKKISPDNSSSDGADVPKGRPMSPGTLALMCNEEDTMFIASASPNGIMGHGCTSSSQLSCGQDMSEIYAEQERKILTTFRDCLNKLITFGEIKEAKCSYLAQNNIRNHNEQLCNGATKSQIEGGSQSQNGAVINGGGVIPPNALHQKITSLAVESKERNEKEGGEKQR